MVIHTNIHECMAGLACKQRIDQHKQQMYDIILFSRLNYTFGSSHSNSLNNLFQKMMNSAKILI